MSPEKREAWRVSATSNFQAVPSCCSARFFSIGGAMANTLSSTVASSSFKSLRCVRSGSRTSFAACATIRALPPTFS